mmetsp:Transcript_27257/g.57344  ORF Transcript_27257/g.57344 Transcript_27257/m.57344 type:complete len:893 (-) Transcript_27257:172-2850(-)
MKATPRKFPSVALNYSAKKNGNGSSTDVDENEERLPSNLELVITKIHLRSLLQLGEYSTVLDHCRKNSSGSDPTLNQFAEEEAYALYRLKRYNACREFCENYGIDRKGGVNISQRGLLHVYAQSLYRLGETRLADEMYRRLLLVGGSDEDEVHVDVDEREDSLSNALANRTANYTSGSLLVYGGERDSECWLEEDSIILDLLREYSIGVTNDGEEKMDDEDEKVMLQNYDLAYNLATFLLVSSEARPPSVVKQAKELLIHAEKSALTILDSDSNENEESKDDENGGVDAEAKKKLQQKKEKQLKQQKELAEQEAGPIRANLAFSNILLGGEENETEALKTYLTMVTKAAKSGKGTSGIGTQANLLATASNNLAVLRDGKESVFDVLKRIPVTSSLSVSEDQNSGGGGGAATVPLVGATPQQVRTALFNRALQLAKMGNSNGCLETLGVLRASLLISSRGDGNCISGAASVSIGGGTASKKNSAKSKKKKGSGSTTAGGAGEDASGKGSSVENDDVPTAKPSSEMEVIAWNARADWLESELLRLSSQGSKPEKKHMDLVNRAIKTLDEAPKSHAGNDASGVLPYTKSQILLHCATVDNPQSKPQPLIDALESLPSKMLSFPGTIVTLATLYGSCNDNSSASKAEELLASLGDNISAKLAVAEFRLAKGRYDDAVKVLDGLAEEDDSMTAKALLVQALSFADPEKAAELANDLEGAEVINYALDGEALESMEIPRFAKKFGASAGEGGSKVRKLIETAGGRRGSSIGERKKQNREAILRKRAKRREAYLARLQAEGRYNPDQTPLLKPDPERWIPKSQRSYNRRGRRGRYKSNIGAQGGGAGAGMEKDAAKLDVAARAAAAKAGVVEGSGKPSTANIKVSGGGGVRKGKGGRRR